MRTTIYIPPAPAVRHAISSKKMENPLKTRTAKQAPNPVEPTDIQNLLAAINKYEVRDKLQIPADRSIRGAEDVPPPTNRHGRVANILDSLSALLVSKLKHEVIATGLRVDVNAKTIQFILSSDGDIPTTTIIHARWIWNALGQISARFHELYPKIADDNTPTHEIKDGQLREQTHEFAIQCIKFNFSRVQKRVNSKFRDFSAIDHKMFDADHPFQRVLRSINTLEGSYTKANGSMFGRPADDDEQKWPLLVHLLRECQGSIKTFFTCGGFSGAELLHHVSHFVKWEAYLRKIAGIMNDVDVLLKAAYSRKCRHLFSLKLIVDPLPSISSKAQSVPQTQKDWETVLENALAYWEEQQFEHEPKLMNMTAIEKDTAFIAQQTISNNLVLHAEVKLLLAIARSQTDMPHLAKAYSYLGVSKLSCRGCHAFIQAYNRAHPESRYITRGSHGKSYWPWKFPDPSNFSKSDETAEYTYRILAQRWVNTYEGYQPEKVQLIQPDFTAGSDMSPPLVGEDDAAIQRLAEEQMKLFDDPVS
ncbi:hypothetical protein FQN54_005541 [Arachnomyces sp. PD_36]|nr:hypothetical protein FQN54_005541 [Arachnomyces sp. PD_36]